MEERPITIQDLLTLLGQKEVEIAFLRQDKGVLLQKLKELEKKEE